MRAGVTVAGSVHADGEDEEAFMDCLVTAQLPQGAFMPAVLKVRVVQDSADSGAVEWSDPIMLLPGSHAAGRASNITCTIRNFRSILMHSTIILELVMLLI